jgi:hypothetical protein
MWRQANCYPPSTHQFHKVFSITADIKGEIPGKMITLANWATTSGAKVSSMCDAPRMERKRI